MLLTEKYGSHSLLLKMLMKPAVPPSQIYILAQNAKKELQSVSKYIEEIYGSFWIPLKL